MRLPLLFRYILVTAYFSSEKSWRINICHFNFIHNPKVTILQAIAVLAVMFVSIPEWVAKCMKKKGQPWEQANARHDFAFNKDN